MATGIVGASLTTLTNGTTANATDVLGNDQALKNNGVDNCGGQIQTDGAGGLTVVKVSNSQGVIRGAFVETTPYRFASGASILSGNTIVYPITGNGSPAIPAGTTFVYVSCFWVGSAAGTYVQIYPLGGTNTDPSNWPLMGQAQVSSGQVAASAVCALDVTGNLVVKASGGNVSGFNASVYGYVY
jgi:hypothetical protein